MPIRKRNKKNKFKSEDTVIKDRNGAYIATGKKQKKALNKLYGTVYGRAMLKLLVRPTLSKAAGKVLDSRLSRVVVRSAMKNERYDKNDYVKDKFRSYNDYFTRQIKPEKRRIDMDPGVLISPCDSKLTVYQLDDDSVFCIKGSMYNVSDLLGGARIAEEFKNGLCLIFRLTVDDYHRYCYFDSGRKGNNHFIKGMLHTVDPVVIGRYNIYKRNSREYTVMETVNFGRAVQVEIGAMMVGKIINHHGSCTFVRGEEKGLFEFGGSTVVLLLKSDAAVIDEDILTNSAQNIETVVRMGERIGVSPFRNL